MGIKQYFFLLFIFASMDAFPAERKVEFELYGFSELYFTPIVFRFFSDGSFYGSESDVERRFRKCAEPENYQSCIVTDTPFLKFAVPKGGLEIDFRWEFEGYYFQVVGYSSTEDLYLIESRLSDSLKEVFRTKNSSFALRKVLFLYSGEKGLISVSKYFYHDEKIDVENWIVRKNQD
ncbi:hypothetical protein [Microbulbifer thermotolerans]|uniref:Uncharacterized protein n=1 Tax=Microbulbifer thermotolerans TaxID=252514 RepID=A0A143HLB1_MICTH|nr:hypothetical protein [Microbulbifer thermotolerans]AMX02307.1 hypothetical protein A3224_06670 [Microbulbifer thermotolerans]